MRKTEEQRVEAMGMWRREIQEERRQHSTRVSVLGQEVGVLEEHGGCPGAGGGVLEEHGVLGQEIGTWGVLGQEMGGS